MKDQSYIERLHKAKIQFNPMTGQELTKDVLKTLNAPKIGDRPLSGRDQLTTDLLTRRLGDCWG